MDFAVNAPINRVSFGQVSIAILREFHKLGLSPNIFPIGQVDFGTENVNQNPDFYNWVISCIAKASLYHKKVSPAFKLWHLNEGLTSVSHKQLLYSFYELDNPTETELNVVRNTDKVVFSSRHAADRFIENGATNVASIPLGFDSANFYPVDPPDFSGRISFNILGKLERRKLHSKTIQAWLKKYGNDNRYFLNCAIFNPFLQQDEINSYYNEILQGKHYFNIHFHGFIPENASYNTFLNSSQIVLGMSGGEGWGLPEFNSVALGKHAVIHNCAGYQEWANGENSVLVNPSSKVSAHDGKFFINGAPWNQGNIFVFNDDDFISGCEEAIKRVEASSINWAGVKLQHEFTYKKTAEKILDGLKELV